MTTAYNQLRSRLPLNPKTWLITGVAGVAGFVGCNLTLIKLWSYESEMKTPCEFTQQSKDVVFAVFFLVSLLASFCVCSQEMGAETITMRFLDPITYTSSSLSESTRANSFYKDGQALQLCPGEYEAIGLLVEPEDSNKTMSVSATDLTSSSGNIISREDIDIRYVKKWYQGHLSSINTRADGQRYLVYELLLKDDSLVKVDIATQKNYLRINEGQTYFDISGKDSTLPNGTRLIEPDDLAEKKLENGEDVLLWVTIKAREDLQPDDYSGKLVLTFNNNITVDAPLKVTVLPITLKKPSRDFGLYYRARLNADTVTIGANEKTPQQYKIELDNMKRHGVEYPTLYEQLNSQDSGEVPAALRLRQQANLAQDKIFVVGYITASNPTAENLASLTSYITRWKEITKQYGYSDFYVYGRDEAQAEQLTAQLDSWRSVRAAGGKMFAAVHIGAIDYVNGYLDQPVLAAKDNYDEVRRWVALGIRPYVYSNPQVGIENPELYRRNYGFEIWLSPYGGVMNYAYQHAANDIWNDFDHDKYRDHVFAYPITNGVIDTIQWEGFREAVDDVRYADALASRIGLLEAENAIRGWLETEATSAEVRKKVIIKILENSQIPAPVISVGRN